MKDFKKILFVCMTLNILMFYLLFTWNYAISVINPFVMYVIVSLVIIMSYIIASIIVFISILNEINEDDEL
jgi:hypothetical protein|nr:MAG TPA: hypothetical protein [Caudoviricetes sp.]